MMGWYYFCHILTYNGQVSEDKMFSLAFSILNKAALFFLLNVYSTMGGMFWFDYLPLQHNLKQIGQI